MYPIIKNRFYNHIINKNNSYNKLYISLYQNTYSILVHKYDTLRKLAYKQKNKMYIKILLYGNCNIINLKNNFGATLLHYSVYIDDINYIKFLLRMGADVNAQTNDSYTPLHNNVYNLSNNKHGKIFYYLLVKWGANIHLQNNNGLSSYNIMSLSNYIKDTPKFKKFIL